MNDNPVTLRDALEQARTMGLARLDAAMLLLHALGRPTSERAWLIAHDTDPLDAAIARQFATFAARRVAGEPLAYLTGEREFYGLTLQVDARVLDPRPDTETLVEWALRVLPPQPSPTVLDLGTGSGAVALALQHQRPDATVLATDRSADALAVAHANAGRLGLPVRFVRAEWFQGLHGPFDLIVSNPPYIADCDPHLAALTHEPLAALAAGPEGLDDLRTIIEQAGSRLACGGWLLLEHGWDQVEAVAQMLTRAGFADVQSRTDLAGTLRCSGGRWIDSC